MLCADITVLAAAAAPRVPLVDLQTGLANPIWYRLFEQLFNMAGVGGVPTAEAFSIMPAQPDLATVAQFVRQDDVSPLPAQFPAFPDDVWPTPAQFPMPPDDVTPQAQGIFFAADDVMPVIAALQAEVAGLRAEIDDLRKGTIA